MGKKLTRHGNSMALVIDRPILELLKIDEKTDLELFTDGSCLVVMPQKDPKREKTIRAALDKVNHKHAKVLKRLAE
jgi:antitoxin component of MazEF toxin-antitoxin module